MSRSIFIAASVARPAAARMGVAVHCASPAALMNSVNASLPSSMGFPSRTYFSNRAAPNPSQNARCASTLATVQPPGIARLNAASSSLSTSASSR